MSAAKNDNRKIKSRKTIIDGIEFDSLLEGYCYKSMKLEGFDFVIKPQYEILPEFRYQGKKIQDMVWTPDFYLPKLDTIVETKGRANESFPVRLKIFLWRYCKKNGGTEPKIVILKNQKEVRDFIIEYKEHFI